MIRPGELSFGAAQKIQQTIDYVEGLQQSTGTGDIDFASGPGGTASVSELPVFGVCQVLDDTPRSDGRWNAQISIYDEVNEEYVANTPIWLREANGNSFLSGEYTVAIGTGYNLDTSFSGDARSVFTAYQPVSSSGGGSNSCPCIIACSGNCPIPNQVCMNIEIASGMTNTACENCVCGNYQLTFRSGCCDISMFCPTVEYNGVLQAGRWTWSGYICNGDIMEWEWFCYYSLSGGGGDGSSFILHQQTTLCSGTYSGQTVFGTIAYAGLGPYGCQPYVNTAYQGYLDGGTEGTGSCLGQLLYITVTTGGECGATSTSGNPVTITAGNQVQLETGSITSNYIATGSVTSQAFQISTLPTP
jgi:hypothetical protein